MPAPDPTKFNLWKQRFADWEESGKSGTQWSREHKIPYSTFQYWKNRVMPPAKRKPQGFLEISTESDCSVESGIEIHIGPVEMRVHRDFDETTLCRLLTVLGRAS